MEIKRASFLIYLEDEKNYDILTDEELGLLVRSYFKYVKNATVPKFEDRVLTTNFNIFKDRYDRDDKRYQEIIKERSKAGKKSAAARKKAKEKNVNKVKQNEQVLTSVKFAKQNLTNSTDREREREREQVPVPDNEQERDNSAQTREASLSLEKFKVSFPGKKLDGQLLEGQDIDKLIAAIQKSKFLASSDNLTLKWFIENYDEVVSGKYDNYIAKKDQANDLYKNLQTF